MLRKICKLCVISITLFYLYQSVYAYEYINEKNKNFVDDRIEEIYDSKQQYIDLVGDKKEETVEIQQASSTSYWWPIGSTETTEVDGKIFAKGEPAQTRMTSSFGYRADPFGSGATVFHSGMDLAGGTNGEFNIIASRDGVVVYPGENVDDSCPSSTSLSTCGGSYGNYVIIQHSDGNYTLYAHMHQDTITVKAGDSVEQGQVIGKMGSSGSSTGTHLHFEVREGQNAYSATVDPANYISIDNPREVSTTIVGEFITWLGSWEGHTPMDGDYYIVQDIGDGVRTVGVGVTLENNVSLFSKYGINVNDYPVGSKISIEIVDQIKSEIVAGKRSNIENVLANNSITLKENEIEALISQMYNTGNISGFVNAYNTYGNTQDLYDNWFFRNTLPGTIFEKGLIRRRNAEWALFHTGEYVYN